jgi:hypothetical protein
MSDIDRRLFEIEAALGEHPWNSVISDARAEIERLAEINAGQVRTIERLRAEVERMAKVIEAAREREAGMMAILCGEPFRGEWDEDDDPAGWESFVLMLFGREAGDYVEDPAAVKRIILRALNAREER